MDVISFTCQAVLFDCDGVLVDSTLTAESAWRQWAQEYHLHEMEVLRGIHGRRSVETVAMHLPPHQRRQGLERIEEIELRTAIGTKPIPGAAQALASLTGKWAIVTSATPALLKARLDAADLRLPQVIVTGDDVPRGKPAPDGYLLAASHLDVEACDCLIFEDSKTGVAAAVAAGAAHVLGVGADALQTPVPTVVADLRGITLKEGALQVPTKSFLRSPSQLNNPPHSAYLGEE